jgi:5-formyltetrahydrofolate cyclo-ligase
MEDVKAQKKGLRQLALELRKNSNKKAHDLAAQLNLLSVLNSLKIRGFSGYIPIGSEIDPVPVRVWVVPDLLIVPLLLFDPRGARLGYGGGFYDRTIQQLRSRENLIAIGMAYSSQQVDSVPVEDTDQYLDGVVTEKEIFWFNRGF